MHPNRRRFLEGIGAASLLLIPSVGTAAAEEDSAGLRVAHASPDAPNVDVYVDGATAVADLPFRAVTEYLEVPTGEREIAINVAGTDRTVFGPVAVDLAGEDYTALARGEVTSDDSAFTVDLLEDTNGANLGEEARVRAIHASPDAPAVDVTVNDGALTLFDDLAFGESSEYAVVPAAEYEVEIRPAGGGDPVFEVTVPLEAGSTYTAIAAGYLTPEDEPADEAFGLVLSEDASAPPRGDGDEDEDGEEEDEDETDEEGPPEDDERGPPEGVPGRGPPEGVPGRGPGR